MKMKLTECSETSAHTIQTPQNNPKGRIQHSEYGGSSKSRTLILFYIGQVWSFGNTLTRHTWVPFVTQR